MKEVLIFVYGTLKSKQCRSRIMDGCQFVGEAKTKRDYKLVNLGSFPGLVPAKNGDNVAGELYVVDENKLRQLDMIEGSMYKFEKIELEEVKLKEKPLSEAANGQLEEMKPFTYIYVSSYGRDNFCEPCWSDSMSNSRW